MNEYALKYTGQEEVLDIIELAERSFGADLNPVYNTQVNTLGEFIDLMHRHTPGGSTTDCTTQQAFYRFRSSMALVSGVDPGTIISETTLADLMPLVNRWNVIAGVSLVLLSFVV